MKLYIAIIDWSYYGETKEAEWFHFVADSYEHNDIKKRAVEHLVENAVVEAEDAKVENLWINEITEVDGYNISVSKQ